MQLKYHFKCPNCDSEYFVSEPNRYDILEFINNNFKVIKSEFINDKFKIFCRKCGIEINENASVKNKKVILDIA